MKRKATYPQKFPGSQAVAPSGFLHTIWATTPASKKRSFLPRNLLQRKRPKSSHHRSLSIHSNQMKNGRVVARTQKVSCPFGCVFCSEFSGTGAKEDLWVHCLRVHEEYESRLVQTTGGKFHLICKQDFEPKTVDWNNRMSSEVIFDREKLNGSHQPINDSFNEIVQMPQQQYHHSGTLAPMSQATWLLEMDSDQEDDEQRLRADRMREAIIDDFVDVTRSQKRFFKLWNRFISHTHNTVYRQRLPQACISFVQQHAKILQHEKSMEEELISHLTNLHDEGVMGRIHISEVMRIYNELVHQGSREDVAGRT